jgi:hypothetical protein
VNKLETNPFFIGVTLAPNLKLTIYNSPLVEIKSIYYSFWSLLLGRKWPKLNLARRFSGVFVSAKKIILDKQMVSGYPSGKKARLNVKNCP